MRYALPGSALVHALALGTGLLVIGWPQPDDAPAAQSVSVEVIAIASVSANQTSTIQSDATETLVSAGAEAVPASTPEMVEAIEPLPIEPVETVVEAVKPPPLEPVEATEPVGVEISQLSALSPEPLQAEAVAAVAPTVEPSETLAAVEQPVLEPTEMIERDVAPTPHVLSRPRPTAPTQIAAVKPRPAAAAGNGGQNQADTVAAKPSGGQQGHAGSGGDAETARYPSQVLAKLRRALRYPGAAGGAAGEVHVQFSLSAAGQPSGVRIVRSSGNAAIDQAGLETVQRAAPFPPIPAGANRADWGFTIPLAFVRG
jgi:protein TonB